MIGVGAFAVFALGLRHGADPDHLAAIDNLTRNSFERKPWLSRFCGSLFAGGHSVMVLSIAALVGILGTHLGRYGPAIETAGTWISIVVLVAIALLNLRQLRGGDGRLAGVKTRFLPRVLREATSPWVALPVGVLFGFGFETSSQVAT
jgi:high-affinity nickel-transport protein